MKANGCIEVLECAKRGIKSAGVELNSVLVAYSRFAALTCHRSLAAPATFSRRDIFKTNMQEYKTAVIFGAESLMDQLVPKVVELEVGTRLIACRFPLPQNDHFKLVDQVGEGIDAVWVYKRIGREREEPRKEGVTMKGKKVCDLRKVPAV